SSTSITRKGPGGIWPPTMFIAVSAPPSRKRARRPRFTRSTATSPWPWRAKGEAEPGLAALNFPAGLKVFRPSLIVGERSERRPAESIAMALMSATRPLFAGGLARYRAIDAEEVARAMHRAAFSATAPGVHVYEGQSLFALA